MLKEYCELCEKWIRGYESVKHRATIHRGGSYRNEHGGVDDFSHKLVDGAVCDSCWAKINNCLCEIQEFGRGKKES